MKTIDPNQNLQQGSQLLDFAGQELNRAEEDVVTFLACNTIKRGINCYLMAFLQSHGQQPPREMTSEQLREFCIAIDPLFEVIDFTPLDCSHEEGAANFCLEIDHVQECLDLAHQVRDIVLDRIER